MMSDQQLVALWEIAVFLNEQTEETKKAVRELHKKDEIRALNLIWSEMHKL